MHKSSHDRFQKRNALYVLILFLSVAFSSSADVNVTVSYNFSGFDMFKTSSDVSSNMNIECVRRFAPIISTLSPDCQSRIVSAFKENKAPGRCCVSSTFVKSVRECLRHDVNLFAKSMTGVSQSNKKSFGCFRRKRDNSAKRDSKVVKEEGDREDNYMRSLLLGYNNHTHLLSKCLVGLSMNTLQVLSRMCLANSTLPKFFRQDSQGNFVHPLKRKEDDLNLYRTCGSYLKSHVNVSSTLQESYLEQVNSLMGDDKCNYFSDFFSFDVEADRNDPYFPSSVVPTQTPGSLETLLANWFSCATTNTKFDYSLITALNNTVYQSQNSTPNGLATSIGRREINLDYLKSIFYIEQHNSFHVSCKGTNCTALCSGCSSLNWNSSNVVLDSSISNFDYSCCNNTCVVAVVQNNGFSASEVFVVKGDNWSRRVDNLLVEKLRNAQTCFNHRRSVNQTTNSTRNNSNVQFSDSRLTSAISDIQSNPNNYNVDFRLGVALNLNVRPYSNATQVSLLSFLSQDLYARNESFFLSCENGQCTYQCRNCNSSGLTFSLLPNTTNNTVVVSNVNSTVLPTNNTSTPSKRTQLRTNSQTNRKQQREVIVENNGNLGVNRGSILLGYLSNSNYPASTVRTNQQIGMRYNLYSNINSGLSYFPRFRRNSTRNTTSTSLGTRTLRPSYYSLYRSSEKYLPSWGFYRSYNLPQFQFDSYRATIAGIRQQHNVRPKEHRSNVTVGGNTHGPAHNGAAGGNTHRPAHNGTSGGNTHGTAHNGTAHNGTAHNGTAHNGTAHNGTAHNGTAHNNSSSNTTNTNSTSHRNTTQGNHTQATNNTIHARIGKRSFAQMKITLENITQSNTTQRNTSHTNITQGNNTHTNHTHGNQTHGNQTHGNHTHGNQTHRNQTHGNHTNGNQTHGNHKQHGKSHKPSKTSADLRPSYNPYDWMPSFRAPFDLQTYMNLINQKLNQVKIYVECCKLFCVTYIESFDDGLSQLGSARRVFVDFNLRNYFGLDTSNLPAQQKTCLVGSLYSNTSNAGWVQSCQIDAPFRTFPLKDSCRNSMNRQCGSVGFDNIFDRFDGKCEDSLVCDNVNDNSSEAEKLNCGAQISTRFLTNNFQIHFASLVNPCARKAAHAQTRLTSLIQTHFMKKVLQVANSTNSTNTTTTNTTTTNATTTNGTTTNTTRTNTTTTTTVNGTNTTSNVNTTSSTNKTNATGVTNATSSNTTSSNTSAVNSSSPYVNEASLTPAERGDLNTTITTVNTDGSITVSIDSNTNLAPNTNVEADLNRIKLGNASSSKGSFAKLSGLLILILAVFFI